MNYRSTSEAKVLVAATVGLAFSMTAVINSSFGVFIHPLSQAFGWERGGISFAVSTYYLLTIVTYPAAGWLIDRWGVRRVLIPSIVLFGLTLTGLSFMSGAMWQLYVGYGLVAVVAVGTTSMSYSRLIVSWFSAKRGLALGTALAGMGIGVALIPLLVQAIINTAGWRIAYVTLGAVVSVVVLLVVLPWARDPQEHKRRQTAGGVIAAPPTTGLDFPDAIRSRSFLLLTLGFFPLGVMTGSIPTHLVPLLVERGIDATRAAMLASSLGFSLIAGRIIMGYLMDRIFAPFLMVFVLMMSILGLITLLVGVSALWILVSICLLGFSIGAEVDFTSYLVSRYIGLRSFTSSLGLLMAVFNMGASAGPAVMGYSSNTSGTYDLGLKVLIVLMTSAVAPFLCFGRYPDTLK